MKCHWVSLVLLAFSIGLSAQGKKESRALRPQQEAAVAAPPTAETRIALVIGNGGYSDAPLKNPVSDARAMKTALEACAFQATLLENASKRQMEDAIRTFGDRIRGGAVGLFYYAGHGVQAKGANYLIPIGARLDSEVDVTYEGVDVGQVLDRMEAAKNGLNILILDACRNNPFARSWRSADRGLAQVSAPTGSLIAYATAPGRTAADGEGIHGAYTGALLEELREPGVKLEEVFKRVRQKVKQGSTDAQVPWESNSTVGDFYFRAPLPVTPVASVSSETQMETEWWRGIQDSREAKAFEAYLARFPAGAHASEARERVRNVSQPTAVAEVVTLSDPAKALAYLPKLESSAEYGARLAAMGWLSVGTVKLDLESYDPETRLWRIPFVVESWGHSLVPFRWTELELSKAQVRELLANQSKVILAVRLEGREGVAHGTAWRLYTPLGPFPVGAELPPIPGARRSPFGLWELKAEAAGIQMALVQVPSGRFTMGYSHRFNDPKNPLSEWPAHPVILSRPFWMGQFPVTQAQWVKVMGSNPSRFAASGPEAPVEQVTWEDCQQFLARLNAAQTSWTFRLCTEAEWEWACQGGEEPRAFNDHFPENITYGPILDIAWVQDNSGLKTHAVGGRRPNGFGLYDMMGNVKAYCLDWFGPYPLTKEAVRDPQGPVEGKWRVVRGADWASFGHSCSTPNRKFAIPDQAPSGTSSTATDFSGKGIIVFSESIGFRVVAVARTP